MGTRRDRPRASPPRWGTNCNCFLPARSDKQAASQSVEFTLNIKKGSSLPQRMSPSCLAATRAEHRPAGRVEPRARPVVVT